MEKTPLLLSAADIAKDRFDKYLKEKLKNLPDDCIWEFYTYLFEQAQNKKVNFNYKKMYTQAYKQDEKTAYFNLKNV